MSDDNDNDEDDVLEPTPLLVEETQELESALADPAGFVAGMTETHTYSVFVTMTQPQARAKWPDRRSDSTMYPHAMLGVDGCLVTTTNKDFYEALLAEFWCE